jgi:hypothetical protein
MVRAVHEYEKRAGVFGPTVLQESKATDLTEQLPKSDGKGTPDPLDRLFTRMGLEHANYPKAEVKMIDEAPIKARLVTEPKPTIDVEEARGRLLESMGGGGTHIIPDDVYIRLCR